MLAEDVSPVNAGGVLHLPCGRPLQHLVMFVLQVERSCHSSQEAKTPDAAFPAAPCCVDVNDRLRDRRVPSAECPIAEKNLAKGLLDPGPCRESGHLLYQVSTRASQVPSWPSGP